MTQINLNPELLHLIREKLDAHPMYIRKFILANILQGLRDRFEDFCYGGLFN